MEDEHTKNFNQSIRLKEYPPIHSENAYRQEFYFEALTVLHGFTESRMKELFHLNASIISGADLGETWDINEKLSYISLVHVLFVLKFINKSEYDTLTSFNAMRNEMIHRFYHEPYEEFYYGVSKKKFDSCYKQTLKLSYKLQERIEKLV